MPRQYPIQTLCEPLPDLRTNPGLRTVSSAIHRTKYLQGLSLWESFEGDVIRAVAEYQENWPVLGNCFKDANGAPFPLHSEYSSCGDEQSVCGRLTQNALIPVAAAAAAVGINTEFGDFKTCQESKRYGKAFPNSTVPDFVAIDRTRPRPAKPYDHNVPHLGLVGEAKTPWVTAHYLDTMVKRVKETTNESHTTQFRRALGQIADYMRSFHMKGKRNSAIQMQFRIPIFIRTRLPLVLVYSISSMSPKVAMTPVQLKNTWHADEWVSFRNDHVKPQVALTFSPYKQHQISTPRAPLKAVPQVSPGRPAPRTAKRFIDICEKVGDTNTLAVTILLREDEIFDLEAGKPWTLIGNDPQDADQDEDDDQEEDEDEDIGPESPTPDLRTKSTRFSNFPSHPSPSSLARQHAISGPGFGSLSTYESGRDSRSTGDIFQRSSSSTNIPKLAYGPLQSSGIQPSTASLRQLPPPTTAFSPASGSGVYQNTRSRAQGATFEDRMAQISLAETGETDETGETEPRRNRKSRNQSSKPKK
ncbi:hypothetical protein FQN57_001429 [Myotisia sp. PD_48]|nr:hypothetical protein FQN57_001429 [Myotisia sp. PD_48]